MTNQEKMEKWTGGDWKKITVFSDYTYENCLIGVSTDGRAVYDFDSAIEFLFNQVKDDYNVADFDDEADMEYSIKLNATTMINDDLAAYSYVEKLPIFCWLTDEKPNPKMYQTITSEFDFSNCIIGTDYYEYRVVYSLSKMIEVIKEKKSCTAQEAKKFIYESYQNAGTTTESTIFYIIVDDCFDLL